MTSMHFFVVVRLKTNTFALEIAWSVLFMILSPFHREKSKLRLQLSLVRSLCLADDRPTTISIHITFVVFFVYAAICRECGFFKIKKCLPVSCTFQSGEVKKEIWRADKKRRRKIKILKLVKYLTGAATSSVSQPVSQCVKFSLRISGVP